MKTQELKLTEVLEAWKKADVEPPKAPPRSYDETISQQIFALLDLVYQHKALFTTNLPRDLIARRVTEGMVFIMDPMNFKSYNVSVNINEMLEFLPLGVEVHMEIDEEGNMSYTKRE